MAACSQNRKDRKYGFNFFCSARRDPIRIDLGVRDISLTIQLQRAVCTDGKPKEKDQGIQKSSCGPITLAEQTPRHSEALHPHLAQC